MYQTTTGKLPACGIYTLRPYSPRALSRSFFNFLLTVSVEILFTISSVTVRLCDTSEKIYYQTGGPG